MSVMRVVGAGVGVGVGVGVEVAVDSGVRVGVSVRSSLSFSLTSTIFVSPVVVSSVSVVLTFFTSGLLFSLQKKRMKDFSLATKILT